MHDLYADMNGIEVIMDDILIHAPTINIHDQRLEKSACQVSKKAWLNKIPSPQLHF